MAEDDYRPADPSALTTAALLREVAHLRAEIFMRLDAMDKAFELFQSDLKRVPTDVQQEVGHLRELHDQRFSAGSDALAAALLAVKEFTAAQDLASATALDKSQAAFDRQISGIAKQLEIGLAASNKDIAGLTSRLDRGEGTLGGTRTAHADRRLDSSLVVAVIAVIVSLVVAVGAFLK